MNYTPTNWYWIVNNDETKVYSSVSGNFVSAENTTYKNWLLAGGSPTRIASTVELGEVLSAYSLRPNDASVLDGYQEAQANSAVVKLLFKLIFQLKNDVLTLQGKPTITAAQARAYVKSQM